jgi:hypothetical protein
LGEEGYYRRGCGDYRQPSNIALQAGILGVQTADGLDKLAVNLNL